MFILLKNMPDTGKIALTVKRKRIFYGDTRKTKCV